MGKFLPQPPSPLHRPPSVPPPPPYYTLPTTSYKHRYITFLKPYQDLNRVLNPWSLVQSVILHSIHLTTKDLLQISPIFVVIITYWAPDPLNLGTFCIKKWTGLKKTKPKIKLNHEIYKVRRIWSENILVLIFVKNAPLIWSHRLTSCITLTK